MTACQSQVGDFQAHLAREASGTASGARWFTAARWLLIATLLAAPLAFGAVEPWAWATLYVLAYLLLVMWAVGSIRQGTLKIAWSPLYLPAALFLLLGAVQYFGHLTMDNYGTRTALIALVTDGIFFFVACQLFTGCPTRVWRRLGLVVAVYAFLVGLFAIVQFFSSSGLIYWVVKSPGNTFGPYVNHNDYAGLMEMLIPLAAMYVLSRSEDDKGQLLLAFALCVPAGSLLLSGSRGGFVSFLGEIAIFAAILWKRGRNSRSRLLLGILGITAAALLFFWMAPKSVSSRLGSVANLVNAPEATYGDRLHVALDSLRIFRDHPLLGTGLGSFGSVFPPYQSFPTDQVYSYAHNDYVQALVETGAAGALILLGALILFFRLAFRNLRERLERETGWIRLGATLGVCGLLIHSFVDFNLHIPSNAAWFVVLAAISTTGSKTQSSRNGMGRLDLPAADEICGGTK
ncbi:MAG TPA: O-antigen ligase family protein [Terriglobia bacterium]|nr:O-antigen ligase family protein [Terriglobia bacterium]